MLTMEDTEEDNWIREFDVSNPQKTHAGYTVYRVSSKVYPKGFPEGASEVIVFKRYTEIRRLYKELKIIYENKINQTKQFPHFSKAHFFSRFDQSVIELRQQQALMLLNFAGNICFMFTSQPFVKFFEGGVEHTSQSSSRCSSDSDQQSNNDETTSKKHEYWTPQTYFAGNVDVNSSDDETFEGIPDTGFQFELQNNETSVEASAPMDSSKSNWLARAISLCSEGDDIEALAAKAGCNENELNKQNEDSRETSEISEPQGLEQHESQPSQSSVDLLPTLLESSEDEEEDVFVKNDYSASKRRDSFTNIPQSSHTVTQKNVPEEKDFDLNSSIDVDKHDVTKQPDTTEEQNANDDNTRSHTPADKKRHDQVGQRISNIGFSWIDPNKKDYLFEAAQIIQQALYSEANEMYEDAFNKYKICVGILLKGVQHDSDTKRREAVRRKTAQYLVKAEFLFNTYLKSNDDTNNSDFTIKASGVNNDFVLQSVVHTQFYHLTLQSLQVIGIINQTMLVQCTGLEGVFVVKVLHKTNAVHRSAKQESKQTSSKGLAKKYIKSPFMVKLHRHFDTSNSIFLLLEYASGGALWNHVNNIRQQNLDSDGASDEELVDRATTQEEIDGQTVGVDTARGEVNTTRDRTDTTRDKVDSTRDEVDSTRDGMDSTRNGLDSTRDGMDLLSDGMNSTRDVVNFARDGLDPTRDGVNNTPNSTNSTRNAMSPSSDGVNSTHSYVSSTGTGEDDEYVKPNCEKGDSILRTKPGYSSPAILPLSNNVRKTSCATSSEIQNSSEINIETSNSERKENCDGLNRGHVAISHDVLSYLDHTTRSNHITEEFVQRWIAELLLAMTSVHSCGIILKDLKPSNVLLDDSGRVLLSYFGAWEEVGHSLDSDAVEHLYCAPEISRGEKITVAADWWSLGVLSYELITGKSLSSCHPWGIYSHSSIDFPSDDISAEARSFLKGLICHNSSERLGSGVNGVEEIKSHAFFEGINWDELSRRS